MRLSFRWSLAFIFLAGCGGYSNSKPAAQVANPTGSAAAPVQAVTISPELAELVKAASAAESSSQFAEAVALRRKIRDKVAAENGPNHWLVANCDLAIAGDERLIQLGTSAQADVARLRELEQQAARYNQSGAVRRALQCVNEARPIASRVFGATAALPLRLQLTAGQMSQQLGDWEMARKELAAAATLARQMFTMPHPDLESALYQSGLVERQLGAFDRSIELLTKSQQLSAQLEGRTATFAARTHELAVSMQRAGRFDDALREMSLSESIRTKELGPQHPLVAESLMNQGVILMDQKKWDAARQKMQSAESICAANTSAQGLLQEVRLHLATIDVVQKDFASAVRHLQAALASIERESGRLSPQYAQVAYRLAMSLAFQADYQQAEPLFRHALAVQRNLLGPTHDQTRRTVQALSTLLERTERAAEAKALAEKFAYTSTDENGERSQ